MCGVASSFLHPKEKCNNAREYFTVKYIFKCYCSCRVNDDVSYSGTER